MDTHDSPLAGRDADRADDHQHHRLQPRSGDPVALLPAAAAALPADAQRALHVRAALYAQGEGVMVDASGKRIAIVERELAAPPEKLWRALTQPHLIEEWLMKNDFKPVE